MSGAPAPPCAWWVSLIKCMLGLGNFFAHMGLTPVFHVSRVSSWEGSWPFFCGSVGAMQFSQLATLLVVLLRAFGEIGDERASHLQEDCAGVGNIACGARLFHLTAARRDVSCLNCPWSFDKTHLFDLETLWQGNMACVYDVVCQHLGEVQPPHGPTDCVWFYGSLARGSLQASVKWDSQFPHKSQNILRYVYMYIYIYTLNHQGSEL